ncbi:hypothetical protein AX17_005545 [Amanita inopinata Kibby_2008]|nr:hypothetical protein AX17_005545 [Amanita inopinata Kibby_2008]
MVSLFNRAWQTIIHSFYKLWSLASYILSLRFRYHPPSTPKPPRNNDTEQEIQDIDLEGGWVIPYRPRLSAEPSTPLTPTPCFRRPRATTLSAISPDAKSTPYRLTVASRASYSPLADLTAGGVTPVLRLSGALLCSFTTTYHEEPDSEETVTNDVLGDSDKQAGSKSQELSSVRKVRRLTKYIALHRDSRYITAKRIKGSFQPVSGHAAIPFSPLSPVTAPFLGSSGNRSCTLRNLRSSSTIGTSDALLSHRLVQKAFHALPMATAGPGHHGHSYSVDLGQVLIAAQSADRETSVRRPWTIVWPVHEKNADKEEPSFGNVTATLLLGTLKANQEIDRRRNGVRITGGPHDVSFVKRMFSVMRAQVELDDQDARHIFNRDSAWDHRKSAAVSKAPKRPRDSRDHWNRIKVDEDDVFFTRPQSQASQPSAISHRGNARHHSVSRSVSHANEAVKLMVKTRIVRLRPKSTAPELSTSSSFQRHLRLERIKRQRKFRQEMMDRLEEKRLRALGHKPRDSYDWFAVDVS